jgi:2-methylaconitate cis-trans-isomerase PrpF
MASFNAAFIRGGTSKALVFHLRDLPANRAEWDAIFLRAMGTPDRYGRQLNGMGGGVSSLSKVCVVGPPTVPEADVDYTFAQVQVRQAQVDYSGNCGNMSSAIGPFAVDEGLVPAPAGGVATVRIHNTNTRKIIHATFPVAGGRSLEEGELEIPGVDGSGAAVRLQFLQPGGASTGLLLPTGSAVDTVSVPGSGAVEVSLVDAANACVFVDGEALGLTGEESPDDVAARPELMQRLSDIRLRGSVAMGIAPDLERAAAIPLIPLIAMVFSPRPTRTLDGEALPAGAADLVVKMLSNGQAHRALPLTGALCTAVAIRIGGSIPNRLSGPRSADAPTRLAMPSGVLNVDADVTAVDGHWHAASGAFYRTTRRLFDGVVHA